jgi:hypothetical protein
MIYYYLNNNNINFYNTNENKINFNKNLLHVALKNIISIKLLIDKNIDWKIIEYMYNQNYIYIPSLYYTGIIINNISTFNYLYNLYLNLSHEELNNISNIKTLLQLYLNQNNVYSISLTTNKYIYYYYYQILSLPVNFDDMAELVAEFFKIIVTESFTTYNYINNNYDYKILSYEIIQDLIYLLFKLDKIKSNPCNILINYINVIIKSYNTNIYNIRNKPEIKSKYDQCLLNIIYIFNYYKFEISDSKLNELLDLLPKYNNEDMESIKLKLITKLDLNYQKNLKKIKTLIKK